MYAQSTGARHGKATTAAISCTHYLRHKAAVISVYGVPTLVRSSRVLGYLYAVGVEVYAGH